jgi:hypothetical protein
MRPEGGQRAQRAELREEADEIELTEEDKLVLNLL